MHKIIFSTFELDLTPYKISTVEDNQWFTGEFYFNYSFPFNFKLTEELQKSFGDLLDDNAKFTQNIYNVTYVFGNTIEKAVFEIESHVGEEVEASFRYGLDAFPLWNKKIRDFNFPVITVPDIYAHAKSLLDPLISPSNNPLYEFPLIFTSKYNTEELTWQTFLGAINNYNTATNSYEVNTNTSEDFANRNIMQPCLYYYYVLSFCFLEAGYQLKGDLISHALFKKTLIYASVDYFKRNSPQKIDIQLTLVDHVQETNSTYNYNSDYFLTDSKKYKVSGDIFINTPKANSSADYFFKVFYNNVLIEEHYQLNPKSRFIKKSISFILDTTTDNTIDHILKIQVSDYKFDEPARDYLVNLNVEEVFETTSEVPDEIEIENTINLKQALPDITFGDLVEDVTKTFNLEKTIKGTEIHFNFIEDQINYNNALDLSNYLVLRPTKTLNKNLSYLFKRAGDSENTNIVYVDRENLLFSNEEIKNNSEIIELKSCPLSYEAINNKTSVVDPGEINEDKINLIVYDSFISRNGGANLARNPEELSLLNIYQVYYQNFLNFIFSATNYKWNFKMHAEELERIDKKVFAYGRYHAVKSIDKSQISEDLFQVEIETETLP